MSDNQFVIQYNSCHFVCERSMELLIWHNSEQKKMRDYSSSQSYLSNPDKVSNPCQGCLRII
jgi:hypothetical protein